MKEFLTLSSAMQVHLLSLRIDIAGGAIPGFFADQSIETLDFQIKANYYTTLWTAHVFSFNVAI